ncbi:uncharacterized protein N7479_001689 [Penicillium vulpinum]|uniref:uncharacterized protein n=1 Tax=Penicillium vulpinum TaxID=29845 RepID=UPI0025479A96|nr:uncharacterized protein N7479_001689 [Penicillium vulpinum]KAJ5971771.1 hypothetical protein N7479_001689 [Penicillium vulpinum]
MASSSTSTASPLPLSRAASRFLDRHGNPMVNLASSPDELICALSVQPNSPNVDWVCNSSGLKVYMIPGHTDGVMALFGQRFGVPAPFDQGCQHCLAAHAVFERCCVAVDTEGVPLFNGAFDYLPLFAQSVFIRAYFAEIYTLDNGKTRVRSVTI